MEALQKRAIFGSVIEISAVDYVNHVNKAGNGVWVVLHLYRSGYPYYGPLSRQWFNTSLLFSLTLCSLSIPLCSLVNQHIVQLARKFPATKFLKSVSTTCIPNYPDKNLPTVFVYFEDDLKGKLIGPFDLGGMKITLDGN